MVLCKHVLIALQGATAAAFFITPFCRLIDWSFDLTLSRFGLLLPVGIIAVLNAVTVPLELVHGTWALRTKSVGAYLLHTFVSRSTLFASLIGIQVVFNSAEGLPWRCGFALAVFAALFFSLRWIQKKLPKAKSLTWQDVLDRSSSLLAQTLRGRYHRTYIKSLVVGEIEQRLIAAIELEFGQAAAVLTDRIWRSAREAVKPQSEEITADELAAVLQRFVTGLRDLPAWST